MVDWDAYRQNIEAAASEQSGHNVAIEGPIEVALFPYPILMVRDVTVASKADNKLDFELNANQADISLKIGPLLVGKPVVRALHLKRPNLSLPEESWRRLRSWPVRWRDWTAPLSSLDLEGISITNGRLAPANKAQDQTSGIRDLSLNVQIDPSGQSFEAAGLFKTKRHSFTFSFEFGRPDVSAESSTKLFVQAQNGRDERTSLRFNGRLSLADDVPSLRGRLALAGPDLKHGLAALAAATGYPSTFRFLLEEQPFAIEGQVQADREGIRVNDVQLRVAEKVGKGAVDLQLHPQDRLNLVLELPTMRLANDIGLADFLPLDVLSKLELMPGDIDIRMREIAYRDASARQVSLALRTSRDGVTTVEEAKAQFPGLIDVHFEGGLYPAEIGSQLRGRLTSVGDDLKRSLILIGLVEDGDQVKGLRNFSLQGDLSISNVEIALNEAEVNLDSSSAKGRAGLRFSGRRSLMLDVDVDRPNLDLYLPNRPAGPMLAELKENLSALDLNIDARFRRLIWKDVYFEDGRIQSNIESGQITFDEILANTVGDTTLSLAGTIDLYDQTVDLETQIRSQQPFRALRHIDLDLPINASRLRPIELAGNIKGTADRFEMELETRYDGGSAGLEGEAGWVDNRLWYNFKANASHPDNQALALQLGLAPLVPEGDARGPLELTGRVRYDANTSWIASGSWKLGPTTFTGSLSYEDTPFASPFDAKLSVGTPQKDSLTPFLILTGLRLTGDWTPARWLGRLPTSGLRTAWLKETEGAISLTSKGGIVGENLAIEATLKDGLLYVEQIDANPWNGSLHAEITLERRRDQPFLAVAVSLDQVEASDFAEWLGVKSGLSGPLTLRFEANSVGVTAHDLIASLSGDLEMTLGPGRLEGIGIPGLKRFLSYNAAQDGAATDRSLILPFDVIDAKTTLSRGILNVESGHLSFSSATGQPLTANLNGNLDLLLWIVDLSLMVDDEERQDDSDPPQIYHMIGPPYRPFGVTKDGN
jgi:uncharacterized protein involved in outer membrane biogenesis